MEVNTKVSGRKVNTMAKEYIRLLLEQSMMVNGLKVDIMELVLLFGLMEVFTKESGRTAEKMVKESLQELMALYMRANGRMESTQAKAN